MSVTLDTNVLVYAANEGAPEHAKAAALVDQLGRGPEIAYLFWPVAMGFIRIVTHPAILPSPISAVQAAGFIAALVEQPHIRCPGEGEGFWRLHCADDTIRARGNDVPDAHLVTLMRQHGIRVIYTRDRGFRAFDGIEPRDPIA